MDKSICFLTMGDKTWASSRLRSYWPSRYIPGAIAQPWKPGGEIPSGYPVYVWQKNTDLQGMELVKAAGLHNVIDHCDPIWWHSPEHERRAYDLADAVVCATEAAARDYADFAAVPYTTIDIIPDRLALDYYKPRGPHRHADPVRFVWYGMAQNRIALFACLANLERLAANGVRLTMTILDNAPEQVLNWTEAFPVYHTRWALDTEGDVIASHDIALVPPYPGPWGRIKTNNRTLTAWACGLPATTGEDYSDLYGLCVSAQARQWEADRGKLQLTDKYDVVQSALEWVKLYTSLTGEVIP